MMICVFQEWLRGSHADASSAGFPIIIISDFQLLEKFVDLWEFDSPLFSLHSVLTKISCYYYLHC